MKFADIIHKKVAILGLGVEGEATVEYFREHTIAFEVFDEKDREIGKDGLKDFDVIVRSPGVSLKKEYLQNIKGEITSHMKLFFDNCPGKIIGVTGTKGKGTTSTLIYEMLKKAGIDAYLGGNIGLPPLSFLDTVTAQSIVVLEMSSFQLQDMKKSPHISVMLMVTQEHLDAFGNQNKHDSLEEYHEAKRNIFAFQTVDDMAVLNIDYPATKASRSRTPAKLAWVSRYQDVENGCFVRNNEVILRMNGLEKKIIDAQEILLPGGHNLENVCAASMAAHFADVEVADIAFVLKTFKGLEHRIELVREVEGVRYYDDSFSTVPETAVAAIEAFSEPEILILGGSKKGSSFQELGKVISKGNIRAIIGIGIEWEQIRAEIQKFRNSEIQRNIQIVEGLKTMREIVQKAYELAKPGDVVLLSPACASFDMFKNYKDRGNQFKEQIIALK